MPRQRKPSADPVQEALRNHKDKWNKQTSELISKLISFKRGLNGRGDPKEGIPPSSIKEPMPSEIGSVLGQLASEFQQVVGDAQNIIQQQNQYSKTRRKKQNKVNKPLMAPNPTNQLEGALSKIQSIDFDLVKEAGALNRYWQYFSSIFSKKDFDQQRIGLLKISELFYKNCLDLENEVLILNINSIQTSINKFQKLKYSYEALKRSFKRLLELKNPIKKPVKSPDQEVLSEKTSLEKIMHDLTILFHYRMFMEKIMKLKASIRDYHEEKDNNLKVMQYQQITQDYQDLIDDVLEKVQNETGEPVKNLEDVVKILGKEASAENPMSVKLAHNLATRYLKRQLLKALKSNKTATPRLEIVQIVDELKMHIREVMASLKNDIDVKFLTDKFQLLDEKIIEINSPLSILNSLYREHMFDRHVDTRPRDKSWDMALRRKIRQDLYRDIK